MNALTRREALRTERAINATEALGNYFLRMAAVMLATGLSKATIYRLIREDAFPKPFKLGRQAVGWRRDDVADWIASRETSQGI